MGGAPSVPTDPSRRIQVIGAGYSRTGTVSMQLALEKLLNGPVMHGGTQILHREDAYLKKWAQAYEFKRKGDKARLHKLLEEIFAGFVGCTDMPPIDFVPDLLEVYPDAKVVLTTRDPEKWAKSIRPVANNASLWWLPYLMWPVPGWRWFPTLIREFSNSSIAIKDLDDTQTDPYLALLSNWNRIIQEMVPADRLLIMELKDGWEPLCKFLNVPVPNEPLPRANDSAAAEKAALDVIRKLMGIWSGIFGTFGVLSFAAWKLRKTR
ncbi:nad dependent epimerase dehydratase [Colletotrichum karsti]|uniref:Nad dependent epimerase dehydratase n=1 Tax=Colletotrichum karsti TaxID=1095194 RepID=A0A9P6I191_9PEZI|nr:nad dependent epimerase dehydratase [Colletotrichum karsti]KAF9873011.1 nad dependent epimerase dehydratase [Colletotrichum karsti]